MTGKTSSGGRSKGLLVIQDGLGDRPLPALGHQTPLEAACTPHMDHLVGGGVAGLMDIIAPGVPVGTDLGHLALFGQDIERRAYRRGPLEAAGLGIILQPGEVALRCNFGTVDGDFRILDRRAGRIRDGTHQLAEAVRCIRLAEDVEIDFRAATEHRAVLVLRGEDLSGEISDSDPGSLNSGGRVLTVRPRIHQPSARRTAALVNRFVREAHALLHEHPFNRERARLGQPPANAVLTRGAGEMQAFDQLSEQWGLRVACVSGECTVLGIARLAGAEAVVTDQMTASLDTKLSEKAACALEALKTYDLVYLHLKGCDIAGHDRQPRKKKDFIEQTDAMLGEMLRQLNPPEEFLFAFAADHSTPCALGEHSADPVPVFLSGPGVPPDEVSQYGERPCALGGLGRIRCRQFLAHLLRFLSR